MHGNDSSSEAARVCKKTESSSGYGSEDLEQLVRERTRELAEANEALRSSERRQSFLLRLNDLLRPLADPGQIQYEAVCALGTDLGASRVGYAEDQGDGETFVITRNYTDGVPGMEGRYRYDIYGEALLRELRAGRTVVCCDVQSEPTLTDQEKAAHALLQIGATVKVPLLKGGSFVAVLFMHHREARMWSADELALIEAVAERTWAAVGRERAEQKLEAELRDTRLLQEISSALMYQDSAEDLYEKIIGAAVTIMRSDSASMQIFDPGRGDGGGLRLLAFRGLPPRAAEVWEWVDADSQSTCGIALRTGRRSVDPDIEKSGITAGSRERGICLQAGIRAVQSTPLLSRSSRLVGMLSTHWQRPHDPSERDLRLLDILSRQAADLLERSLAEEALRAAKAAAEEASRAKSEFLANMSHEIRTPMTVFMAATEYLLQIDTDPERRELLKMADQSAARLRSLIDDILDLSRIEARRIDIEEASFELHACVRQAAEMFALSAREKGLQLVTEISPETPETVIGDADRVGQILVNLIGNAIKFTRRGEVRIGVNPRGDFLEFTVADTGIGIAPEKFDILFRSFSQVDSSFTRRFGGAGLGLAISKGLVETMGGTISVRSREGEGSEFVFTIPLKEGGSLPTPQDRRKEVPMTPFYARVLLVDDEPLILDMVKKMLERCHCRVETAESGKSAVEKWNDGEFAIVFMDLHMPETNGLDATRTIRRREAEGRRRTWIVGLTAHARPEIRKRCLDAGMDQVMTKPIQMNDLYAVIEGCLGPPRQVS